MPRAKDLKQITNSRPNVDQMDLSKFCSSEELKALTENIDEKFAFKIKNLRTPWFSGSLAKFQGVNKLVICGKIHGKYTPEHIQHLSIKGVQPKELDLSELSLEQNVERGVTKKSWLEKLVKAMPIELRASVETLRSRFFVSPEYFPNVKHVHFSVLSINDAFTCFQKHPQVNLNESEFWFFDREDNEPEKKTINLVKPDCKAMLIKDFGILRNMEKQEQGKYFRNLSFNYGLARLVGNYLTHSEEFASDTELEEDLTAHL